MHLRFPAVSAAPLASLLALVAIVPLAAWAEPLRAVYSVRGGGLQMAEVEAVFDLDTPGRYDIRSQWRTTGMARLFGSAQFSGGVAGRWAGNEARPSRYMVDGTYRGEPRRTVLDYPNGQPVLTQRLPQPETEHEPVPEVMTRDTIDQFSAFARLLHQLSGTGRCDGQAAVFDGIRRIDMRARTEGRQRLEPWSTAWAGEAVRCSFSGTQIAGFKRDDSESARARAREPQEGTAWLAPPRPGDLPIPVRMEIPSRVFGSMTVYLMEFGPASAAASSAGSASGRSATGAPPASPRAP